MNKLCVLSFLLLVAACKPDNWQTFALDQRVSVLLPRQPVLVELNKRPQVAHPPGVKMWQLVTSTGAYLLTRTVQAGYRFPQRDTLGRVAFYTQTISRLRSQHVQDIRARRILVGGLEGREIVYFPTAKSTIPTCTRCFALDSVAYSVSFFPGRQPGLLKLFPTTQRWRFFDSVTVKT